MWLRAIREELDALRANGSWEIVTKPKDRKLITSRWVFKIQSQKIGVG